MLGLLLHGLCVSPASLDEVAAIKMALERLGLDAVIRDARRGAEAEADAQTSIGPTSMGWTREQLFGANDIDEDALTVSQSLELSGRSGRRASSAKAAGVAARHAAESHRNDHVRQLRLTFHEARLARARVDVFVAWRVQLAASEAHVQRRVAAGAEPAWASRHSHHELSRGELIVAQLEAERDGLLAELMSLIGWPKETATPTLAAAELPSVQPGGVEAYLARLADHPRALTFEALARSGALRQEAGARSWVPELEVSLGYKTASNPVARDHGYTAGANLSIPLSGDPTAEEGLGRAEALKARSELQLWTHHQEAKVRGAYLRVDRLIAVANLASAHLADGHEQLLASARLAYEGGELDLDGLLEANADARDDRMQALELSGRAWAALIGLDHLTGRRP